MAKKTEKDEEKGPGRPEFDASSDVRVKVERYASLNWSQVKIAAAIGCTVPTLTKYFADELEAGPARQHAEVVDWMFASAQAGNASIQKRLEQMLSTAAAQRAFGDPPPAEETDEGAAKPERLGKKGQEVADAHRAGVDSSWGGDLQFEQPRPN